LLHEVLKEANDVGKSEERYYTARHLLEALVALDERLLDLPLVLIHGKDLSKPNLVTGILPAPVPIDRRAATEKKPSLLALAQLE